MVTTPTVGFQKSNQLLSLEPATIIEALAEGHNLTPEDCNELEGLGMSDPVLALIQSIEVSEDAYVAKTHNGIVVSWFGVQRDERGYGRIWMLTTDEASRCPRKVVRTAKHVIDTFGRYYPLLYNTMDPRNTQHLRFLKLLGFKRLAPVPVGPKGLTFIEFAKLCAHPPSRQSSVLAPQLQGR